MSKFRVGQVWLASGGQDRWRVVAVGPKSVTMRHEEFGNDLTDSGARWEEEATLVEDVPVPIDSAVAAGLARVALEERLDKVERARVYAEDKAASADRARKVAEREVEALRQSAAARDEKERGKIARQAETIKSLEARNAKLVEKVAAQWARAEAAKTAATRAARASTTVADADTIASLRAEVSRLLKAISQTRGVLRDLHRFLNQAYVRHVAYDAWGKGYIDPALAAAQKEIDS